MTSILKITFCVWVLIIQSLPLAIRGCGDHIAVKIKRSKASCFNPWWNHMIVTAVDADIDVIYVVCLCVPDSNPQGRLRVGQFGGAVRHPQVL